MSKRVIAQCVLVGFLCLAFALTPKSRAQISAVVSAIPASASLNVFIFVTTTINPDGTTNLNELSGGILAITNRSTNVPFQILTQSPSQGVYKFLASPPLDDLTETYVVYGANASYNLVISLPLVFLKQPQDESVLLGSNAIFTAQAAHTTGYQWQKQGTNLVEDGHFVGVATATLTITNATTDDAGTYTVVAEQPTQNASSQPAQLTVFKPIRLWVAANGPPGVVRVLAGNVDGSPFEASRLTNVVLYSAGDPGLSFSGGTLATSTILLTNGLMQVDFQNHGIGSEFWRMAEKP